MRACKRTYNYNKQRLQYLLYVNYWFGISSGARQELRNDYLYAQTEIQWACNGLLKFLLAKQACSAYWVNPLISDVCITVSVLDTAYKVDLTFLIVRLSRFQF